MANGMAKELRIRGYLPEEFTMLAYGGNGPLHACGIAGHLGISKVLAPPYSSVFSALGAGNTPQLHIHERTVPVVLFDASTRALFTDFGRFNGIVVDLESKGREDLLRQGLPGEAVQHRLVVARGDVVTKGQVIGYAGQTGDVETPQLHFEIREQTTPVNPRTYLASTTASN